MRAGATFIDHTTASAEVARELNATGRARGIAFLDAPVSGGQAGAQNGTLTVMVGGDEEPFEHAKPLIASYARAVNRIGPSGAGQLTKMVNQIAIAGLLQGLSEAIAFAEAAGLDLDLVMQTISKGAAQSWQMDNRWKTMHEGKFDFGFAVDWMRKDLAICLGEAQRNGAKLPVTALVDEYYAEIQAMGGGRWDTSSLIALLEGAQPRGLGGRHEILSQGIVVRHSRPPRLRQHHARRRGVPTRQRHQGGSGLVNAMHISASVFINDDERGLHHDYEVWLEKLAPHAPTSQYHHNRTGEDNADAHLKRQVMGREVVVAITGGKLDFGPWEQIFYGEFDGGRKKRVLVKIIGE